MRLGMKGGLVVLAALTVGVTAAWAGLPNLRTSETTLDAGTITKGGGKGSTTSRQADESTALAAASDGASVTAILYVRFRATGGTGAVTFRPSATGTQVWQCVNDGSQVPNDPSKTEGPVNVLGEQLTVTASKNGQLVYTGDDLTIELAAPAVLVCPSGQTALLMKLHLTSLVLQYLDASGNVLGDDDLSYPADFVPDGAGGAVWTRASFTG